MDQEFSSEEFYRSGTIISLKKDKILIGWGQRKWRKDGNPSLLSFYFPDFFLTKQQPWFTQDNFLEIGVSEFIKMIQPYSLEPFSQLKWQSPYEIIYRDQFAALIKRFKETSLQKAVPFVCEISEISLNKPFFYHSLYNALRYIQEYPGYIYGVWEHGNGILGATPELLCKLELNNNPPSLHTVALGGTHLKHTVDAKTIAEDPNWKKLLHEHALIVEGISQGLNNFGTPKIGELRLIQLPKITHLCTDIEVKLKTLPPIHEIITTLHPTPALGGFPKDQSLEWLTEYERVIQRGHFGAPIGYSYPGKEYAFYVAIRNIQWNPERIQLCAGGGIVVESQVDLEWKEIQSKIDSIKSIFKI